MVRIKNRYIVVQIVPQNTQTKVLHIKDHLLAKCILSHVQKFYGVYGAGLLEHGFRVKYCNERTKIALLRCSHHSHKFVTSILPLITLIQIKHDTLYIIPHWVKHRVEGKGFREFIKTEIIFKNKENYIEYDQSITDAFDRSCYYMLQSVRHPEFKEYVSKTFNSINEARFFKSNFSQMFNSIYIKKTFKVPIIYENDKSNVLQISVAFITDGLHYYFQICGDSITRNEAVVMFAIIHLDIHPKKLFSRHSEVCRCSCPCISIYNTSQDINVEESIFYWPEDALEHIERNLTKVSVPNMVFRIGNVCMPDIYEMEPFFFAACQNIYEVDDYDEVFLTTLKCKGSVDVEYIRPHIVKIRQSSFKNGIRFTNGWKGNLISDIH